MRTRQNTTIQATRRPSARPARARSGAFPARHALDAVRVAPARPVQRDGEGAGVPHTGDVPEIASSSGSSLSDPLRAEAERSFGADFSGVRVHTGGPAGGASRRLSARAFTVGEDIYFGAGRFQPETTPGRALLGHELTHVVQQRRGLSSAALTGAGDVYEREADAAGAAFAAGRAPRIAHRLAASTTGAIQRSADPASEAAAGGNEGSPHDWDFLGEANTEGELQALIAGLSQEASGLPVGLLEETAPGEAVEMSEAVSRLRSPAGGPAAQRSPRGVPIQRAIVAGCNVPGRTMGQIGVAAHVQLGSLCRFGFPGCRGGHPGVFTGAGGFADLVRNPGAPPAIVPEIGEIKPASWIGRGQQAVAQAQLARYIASWTALHGVRPMPMFSVRFPPTPFVLNSSQSLYVWGPSAGIYYYSCRNRRRRRRRTRRVRRPVRVRVPVRTPNTSPTVTTRQVVTGVGATLGAVGLGYIIYRGIRMLPSLAPPLWWTIPANAAIP